MGMQEFFASKTSGRGYLVRKLKEYGPRLSLVALAWALEGCSCSDIVQPEPPSPPEALSVQCACQITGTTPGGVVQNEIHIDPEVCVPEAYRANPGSYCGSEELAGFLEKTSLGVLESQLTTSCSAARIVVSCAPVLGQESGKPAPSCKGTCAEVACDTENCSDLELWNGSCDCTQGSACGQDVSAAVCAPSFDGSLLSASDEPLSLGAGAGARRALFSMAGGWLPGSTVATSLSFDVCADGSSCSPVSEQVSSEVSGTFELLGVPCPFGTCGLGFHTEAKVDDFTLHLDVPHVFTDVTVEAFARQGALSVTSSGFGYIMPGDLVISARFSDNGAPKVIAPQVSEYVVLASIDWNNKTISIQNLGIGFPGGEGSITINLSGSFGSSFFETFDASLYYDDSEEEEEEPTGPDTDGDGIKDDLDNCPLVANPNQEPVQSPVLVAGSATSGCGNASVTPPTAEDVCFGGPVTVTSNQPSTLPIGATTIIWTATDSRGSTTTLEQTVDNQPVIVGSNSVSLADRAKVPSGAIVSLGNGTTSIGNDAQVGTVLSRGTLEVRDRTRVTGTLLSQGVVRLGSNVTVPPGAVQPNRPLPVGAFPELNIPSFPVGTTQVSLQPGQSRALSPGNFGNINVYSRATLTLAPGDYYLTSLTLEPESRLILSGATRIFVRSSLIMRGDIQGNGTLTLNYTGTNQVTLERNFTGHIRAPMARISLGSGNQLTFRGSVMARDVELRPGASLSCL